MTLPRSMGTRLRLGSSGLHIHWLSTVGPEPNERVLDPEAALRVIRVSPVDARRLHAMLGESNFSSPRPRSKAELHRALESALRFGRLCVLEGQTQLLHLGHVPPEFADHDVAPSEPSALAQGRSLMITHCDPELGPRQSDPPLHVQYLLHGFEGRAVELQVHAHGLASSLLHRRMLDADETRDGGHTLEWDALVSEAGVLMDRRLPPGHGPCRIELVADDVYRDQAPFVVRKPLVPFVRLGGAGYASGRAVFLPDANPSDDHQPGRQRSAGLPSLAFALAHAHDHPELALFVAGHSDSVGAVASNRALSTARAKNVALILEGDAEAWAQHTKEHACVADEQRVLEWIHLHFGAQYDCDPGPIDDEQGPLTRAARAAFRRRHDHLHGGQLPDTARFGTPDWSAIAALYDHTLDLLLGDTLALSVVRESSSFADPKLLGYAQTYLLGNESQNQHLALARSRRAEFVFLSAHEHTLLDEDNAQTGSWLYAESAEVQLEQLTVRPTPGATLSLTVVEREGPLLCALPLELCDPSSSLFDALTTFTGEIEVPKQWPGTCQLRIVGLEHYTWPNEDEEPCELPPDATKVELTLSLLTSSPPSIGVTTDTPTYLVLDRPTLTLLEPSLLHFDHGSPLLVPGPWTQGRHPLAGIVHALVALVDHPERHLFVVGHASSPGSTARNQSLSEARSEGVRALVENDRDGWVDHARECEGLREIIAYLDYLGQRRGWSCSSETPIEELPAEPNPGMKACVSAFQTDYNDRDDFEAQLEVDGDCGTKTLGAVFDVYRDELERWLDKLGTTVDELPLERIRYEGYGAELAGRSQDEAEPERADRVVDLITYEGQDDPAELTLEILYTSTLPRRRPFTLPHEPDEWATGPLTIVSDLTEYEQFEPETYRLCSDDERVSLEHQLPDDGFIEAGEYVIQYEAYHGVLAARAKARAEVVPGPSEEPEPAQLRLVFGAKAEPGIAVEVEVKRSSRHPWAWLLRRVFAVDVLTCERCEGGMRLVEIANEPDEISRVLAKVGLGPRPPPRRRPALPGQLELNFAA